MAGALFAIAPCVVCGRPFSFNVDLVPSVTIDPARGREPICAPCVELVNPDREGRGLPLIEVLPGSYAAEGD